MISEEMERSLLDRFKRDRLEHYVRLMVNNGFDTEATFALLTAKELKELGVPECDHAKILNLKKRETRKLSLSFKARSKDRNLGVLYGGDYQVNFLLVRHGETEANADKSVYKKKADHATLLSDLGVDQAKGAALHIVKFLKFRFGDSPPPDWSCSIWASSYKRAEDTAQIIMDYSQGWITEKNISVFLIEQQFGLFEGVDWSSGEVDQRFPRELSIYNKCSTFGGRFWASIPMGESRFDVCKRVYSSLSTIHKNAKSKKQKFNIIVSHGVTIRAFIMMYFGLQPEWMEECVNPSNCSIRWIEKGADKGYIWPTQDAETPLTDLLSHFHETEEKQTDTEQKQTDKPS